LPWIAYIDTMKQIAALAVSGLLVVSPLQAESSGSDMSDGFNLVEEGMKLFFKGLTSEIEPQLEDFAREMEPAMKGLVDQMGPALGELASIIGEIEQYHPPERLPNGDIILRRKTPLVPGSPEDGSDIEL